jgi:HEAT repeat protein
MSKIALLIAALTASDPNERRQAAETLAQQAEAAQAAAVALVRVTGDDDEEVREAAVGALEDLGPPLVEQLGELAALVADPNADVAYWAVTLLGRLGTEAAAAVPALTAALEPPTAMAVRQRAAWALGNIGAAAAAARPALERAAREPDPRLARLASEALARIKTAG